jgi:hypothetical protein
MIQTFPPVKTFRALYRATTVISLPINKTGIFHIFLLSEFFPMRVYADKRGQLQILLSPLWP